MGTISENFGGDDGWEPLSDIHLGMSREAAAEKYFATTKDNILVTERYSRLPNRVLRFQPSEAKLTPAHKDVLINMLTWGDDWVSRGERKIAKETGHSRTTVSLAIKRLKKLCWITEVPSEQQRAEYRINWEVMLRDLRYIDGSD